MIDAGHGGKDQGTSAGNILEKDLNLQVAEKLAKELKKRGASVLLTRTDDTKIPLEERAAMANEKEADLFVSIHCNYCEDDSSVQGLECYYREGSDEAQKLAENVVTAVEESSMISCRGTRTADFSVLRNTSMSGINHNPRLSFRKSLRLLNDAGPGKRLLFSVCRQPIPQKSTAPDQSK